jgi:hypothetical protein
VDAGYERIIGERLQQWRRRQQDRPPEHG